MNVYEIKIKYFTIIDNVTLRYTVEFYAGRDKVTTLINRYLRNHDLNIVDISVTDTGEGYNDEDVDSVF